MNPWQMQEAKAQLSEVVKQARQEGPQEITLHGHSVAVLLSRSDFDRLTNTNQSLVEFMHHSPLYDLEDLIIERDTSLSREIPL